MKKVPIFIASSIREFDREREQFSEYLDMLNDVHEADGVEIEWKRPETMSHALRKGGSQLPYNKRITQSRFFVLIVGEKLGKHTEAEFNLALEQFKKTGAPVILPYFLNRRADMDVLRFLERLRKELDIGEQYVDTYDNFDQILNSLHIELIRYGAFIGEDAEPSDRETAAQKGLDGIRELIAERRDKIAELKAKPVTPQIIAEMTDNYEEMYRLIQVYKVEPDTLLNYIKFLWQQNLYDKGIKLGKWLEGFYSLENPDEATWAELKDYIALFYGECNEYELEGRYVQEALEIWRHLESENPAEFKSDVARTYNNLGLLFSDTNRMKEAEKYYHEALEMFKQSALENPAEFEPYVAWTCNNLGRLLYDTNQVEDAERYYREALQIYRRWEIKNPADVKPDLANTCNNFGNLLSYTNRIKEAETYYREALEIYQRLASNNPAAFEPDLVRTCDNLVGLLYEADRKKEAIPYCYKALEIYRHLAVENPTRFEPDLASACGQVGLLLYYANQIQEAETYCREALEIYRRLVSENPADFESDLATTCNNLSLLLIEADKMEKAVSKEQIQKAEPYLFETLDIWQRLAQKDPAEFEPCLAIISYNLGVWEYKRGKPDAAKQYFEKSLSLFEKFPDWEKNAQQVRDALAKL